MKLFENKSWLFHILAPLGLALVFGTGDYLKTEDPLYMLPKYVFRPLAFLSLIWVIMVPATALVNAAFANNPIPLFVRLVISALVGAIPFSFVVMYLVGAFDGSDYVDNLVWMSVSEYNDFILHRYGKVALFLVVFWTVITYRWYRQQEQEKVTEIQTLGENTVVVDEVIEETESSPVPRPAFIDKMTKPIGRDVWALKAEQHYIRIYTETGDELILYRFSDAVKSLDAMDGMQVHRSYWVLKEAIDHLEKTDKSYLIHMKNGLEIPVSRSFKPAVEDAGLV